MPRPTTTASAAVFGGRFCVALIGTAAVSNAGVSNKTNQLINLGLR